MQRSKRCVRLHGYSITLSARPRNSCGDRLGGLLIDHQIELGRLLDRQIRRLGALEDLVDKYGAAKGCVVVGTVADQPASLDEALERVDHGRAQLERAFEDCIVQVEQAPGEQNDQRAGALGPKAFGLSLTLLLRSTLILNAMFY